MKRCQQCQKELNEEFPDLHWNSLLKLMHYFEHELSEEEITPKTYEEMTDCLMTLKPWVTVTKETQ